MHKFLVVSSLSEFQFNSGPVALSGLDFGNADAPDMLLLHGMRDLAWSMKPVAEAFCRQYHVVVPDLRGHGDSDNPGIYSMSHFIADLRVLITARELQQPVIIAHSLGGHIAAQYAALFPDEVSVLILIDGMGPPSVEMSQTEKQEMDRELITMLFESGHEARVMKDVEDAFDRLNRNNPGLGVERARELAEKGTRRLDDGTARWKWDAAAQQVWSTFSHDENEDRLSWIHCPVLMVTGEHSMRYWSRMRPFLKDQQEHHDREVERRRKLFRNARHVSINGAGHMIHYDQPDELNREIGVFLDDVLA